MPVWRARQVERDPLVDWGVVVRGVAAGTVVVGVGTVDVGMWADINTRKAVLGAICEKELGNVEQRVILALGSLVATIKKTLKGPRPGQKETDLRLNTADMG